MGLCAHHSTIPGPLYYVLRGFVLLPSKMLCSQRSTVHKSLSLTFVYQVPSSSPGSLSRVDAPQAASLCHYAECASLPSRSSSKIYTHFSDWLWLPKNPGPRRLCRSFLYDPGLPSGPGLEENVKLLTKTTNQTAWGWALTLPLSSCVTLENMLAHSLCPTSLAV